MISVVIPAYNEEGAVGATLDRLKVVLDAAGYPDYEIILVNDGSSDNTRAIAEAKGVQVISHPHNLGYGHSIKAGINAARHEILVITDADGTYPVEEIPALVEVFQQGYHMVVGARTGSHYHESLIKMPLRRILKWLVEFAASRKISDINSGLRVFTRSHARSFFNQLCNTFSFTTSLTLAYMMTGKFVTYVEIPYEQRTGNTKVRLFKDSLRTLQYIAQAILYYNPLKIFLIMCITLLGIAGVSIVLGLVLQLKSAFLLGVGSILLAMLVFAMGLLGDLLRQIMDAQQNRDQDPPL